VHWLHRGKSGRTTLAFSRLCGKSFGLSVTIKSALPSSAQRQNASSPGSGDISAADPGSTGSPALSNEVDEQSDRGGSNLQPLQNLFVFAEDLVGVEPDKIRTESGPARAGE
jgi:hypothetical protein